MTWSIDLIAQLTKIGGEPEWQRFDKKVQFDLAKWSDLSPEMAVGMAAILIAAPSPLPEGWGSAELRVGIPPRQVVVFTESGVGPDDLEVIS